MNKNVKKKVKKKVKKPSIRKWFITSTIIALLLVIVNVLASTMFFEMIGIVLGTSRIEIVGENKSALVYLADEGITDKASAMENGYATNLEACEEGFTLLKNDNDALPLAAGAKISVFGKNSVNMAVGGSGSGGSTAENAKTLFDSLDASGFTYNTALRDFYLNNDLSGEGRPANPSDLSSGDPVYWDENKRLYSGETPQSMYTDSVWNSCESYKDAALIIITRIGGEGFDLPRAADGSSYLQLDQDEKDLINAVASKGFEKVIVILNAAATLELQEVQNHDGVDAIFWMGYPGDNGIMALGELLKGETLEGEKLSPSGRTVDTYAAHFINNPTWNNLGGSITSDAYRAGNRNRSLYFVDYEEGIYVGYRYYETAYAEALKGNYEGFDYNEEVVYPFGYGLSYTNFSWELTNANELATTLEKDTSMTFKVKVTNNGDYPGKDVVQLYVTPPYTAGGVEKSAKVLIGFAKTPLLAPGASETVEITVDSPYAYASYDYKGVTGVKGYVVEAGDYAFTISSDAHNAKEMDNAVVTAEVNSDIHYENDPTTNTKVENLYTDVEESSDTELGSVLSRDDFVGTWPQSRTTEERTKDLDWINSYINATNNPNNTETYTEVPKTGYDVEDIEVESVDEETGETVTTMRAVELSDLSGKDFNDPLWETFLDRLTIGEMIDLFNKGAFTTIDIERLGVPRTTSADGPVGWRNFIGSTAVYDVVAYCCEVVWASTWNTECLYEMGKAVGNEGIIGNANEGNTPYTGWYAPGLNIHRSPFGGRNFEYYSEDAFLSGQMTAALMKGAAEKGVYVTMKHFALNEQETHRQSNGLLTWATEQSIREVYMKAFEVAVKTAKENDVRIMGVMSSFNRIGTRATSCDYRLLTTILRNEWGFQGLVISDYNTTTYMLPKDMVYAGNDLNLESAGTMVLKSSEIDPNNATDVMMLRKTAKNILYNVANSNAMRGDFVMKMPYWQIAMYVVDVVVAVALLAWGVVTIKNAAAAKKAAKKAAKRRKY